jgi:hypothetical protein
MRYCIFSFLCKAFKIQSVFSTYSTSRFGMLHTHMWLVASVRHSRIPEESNRGDQKAKSALNANLKDLRSFSYSFNLLIIFLIERLLFQPTQLFGGDSFYILVACICRSFFCNWLNRAIRIQGPPRMSLCQPFLGPQVSLTYSTTSSEWLHQPVPWVGTNP